MELLSYGFMQRALLAGVMIAVIAPTIGVFLVLRRLSLIADTLAHVALAGVAVGLLAGAHPVAGALVVTVIGAIGVERLRSGGRLFGEAALALFLSGGFAVAVVLISLAGGFTVDLLTYLFGAITAVRPHDLWLILSLGFAVLGSVAVLYKDLFAITFDEEGARVQGVPVDALNLLLTILVAVTVVVTMQIVGILLTSALIVIPALTALRAARDFRATLALAIAAAVVAVVVGMAAAFYLDVAAGGAIVLCSIALFAVASALRR
jgi:zinc transport system permease protein